eukprot:GSMAST32.ASY1.ANO1.1949.1 assembled CDS
MKLLLYYFLLLFCGTVDAIEVEVPYSLIPSGSSTKFRHVTSMLTRDEVALISSLQLNFSIFDKELSLVFHRQTLGRYFARDFKVNVHNDRGKSSKVYSNEDIVSVALLQFESPDGLLMILPEHFPDSSEETTSAVGINSKHGQNSSHVVKSDIIFDGLFAHDGERFDFRTTKRNHLLHISQHAHLPIYNLLFNDIAPTPNVDDSVVLKYSNDIRRRLVSTTFSTTTVVKWSDCFVGGNTNPHYINMGLEIGPELVKTLGSNDKAIYFLEHVIAKANRIYKDQLNVVLLIKEQNIYSDAGTTPNYAKCASKIKTQLDQYLLAKPSGDANVALWHLFNKCPMVDTENVQVGLAFMSSLCRSYNKGITRYFPKAGPPWITFAHEVGHALSAQHSFEEGQGTTGGIMDYGDGRFEGAYQFNTKYRKAQVCSFLDNTIKSKICSNNIGEYTAKCGNGVVDYNETCECDDNKISCACCQNCQLTTGKECSPDSYLYKDCCTDTCMYKKGSPCELDSVLKGICSEGICSTTQCENIEQVGTFCGVEGDGCKVMCKSLNGNECKSMKGWRWGSGDAFNPLTGNTCGNDGLKCSNGVCSATPVTKQAPTVETCKTSSKSEYSQCDKYENCGYVTERKSLTILYNIQESVCNTRCVEHYGCRSFSYVALNQTCQLWSNLMLLSDLTPIPIDGQTKTFVCPSQGTNYVSGCSKFNATWELAPDLGSFTNKELVISCSEQCKLVEGCESFTYHLKTKICKLYSKTFTTADLKPETNSDILTFMCSIDNIKKGIGSSLFSHYSRLIVFISVFSVIVNW